MIIDTLLATVDDRKTFNRYYDKFQAKNVDAMDFVLDEVYAQMKVKDYEEFAAKAFGVKEASVLGQGMSKQARAADVEQSDREYIAQRQQREKTLVILKKDPGGPKTFWSGINWMADRQHAEPVKASEVKALEQKWRTRTKQFPAAEK